MRLQHSLQYRAGASEGISGRLGAYGGYEAHMAYALHFRIGVYAPQLVTPSAPIWTACSAFPRDRGPRLHCLYTSVRPASRLVAKMPTTLEAGNNPARPVRSYLTRRHVVTRQR